MNEEETKRILAERENVSHETFLLLTEFVTFLMQWNKVHNLVSQNSLQEVWHRHVLDSVQLSDFIKPKEEIVDIGSGAGFPGMILAILGHKVSLIERNKKKVAFLTEAARRLKLEIVIKNQSTEETNFENIDIVTARGVAKIEVILAMTKHFMPNNPCYLLQKGKEWQVEMDEAAKKWGFIAQINDSITSAEGKIIMLTKVHRK